MRRRSLAAVISIGGIVAYTSPHWAPPELMMDYVYPRLPSNGFSRFVGRISELESAMCLKLFSAAYKLDLAHATIDDVSKFSNLQSLFTRTLLSQFRPYKGELVSPCDGVVLSSGVVENDTMLQVKGQTFSLRQFLASKEHEKTESILKNPSNKLFYSVIYLSPKDCHRIFSPAVWTMTSYRHVPGMLLKVGPRFTQRHKDSLSKNERVILFGEWRHGFMSVSPVGALNVGSIIVNCAPDLVTNVKGKLLEERKLDSPKTFQAGEELGYFKMGSTVVLIFEAPPSFRMVCEENQHFLYGQELGSS